MNTQIQEGGNDCGLFAIATATTLCQGEDPVDLEYQQSSMRSHLQAPQGNCNEDLTSFQRQQERGRKATIVGSLLQSFAAADYQMIQCSHCNQWYHLNCTDAPKTVLNNNKAHWLCEFNFVSIVLISE